MKCTSQELVRCAIHKCSLLNVSLLAFKEIACLWGLQNRRGWTPFYFLSHFRVSKLFAGSHTWPFLVPCSVWCCELKLVSKWTWQDRQSYRLYIDVLVIQYGGNVELWTSENMIAFKSNSRLKMRFQSNWIYLTSVRFADPSPWHNQ